MHQPTPGQASATETQSLQWTAVAAIGGAAVATALISLVSINRVKDAVIPVVMSGGSVNTAVIEAALRPIDAVLTGAAIFAIAVLFWLELRRCALSRLLASATPAQAAVMLTFIAAWTGHAYLSPGLLLAGDTATHVSRFLEVAVGLRDGGLPTWTNYQYMGAPLLWFTGPLTYVLGGVITLVTGDAVAAFKVFLFVCHMGAGWLFFAFMRRLAFRPVAAMLAAAGFAGCFAHLHLFLYRGVAPQALTILLLVLLFHAAEGLMAHRGRPWVNWLCIALSNAGLIVNHQPHALFAAFYLAVFGGFSLLLGRWRWRAVPALILAATAGVLMAAIAILPVLAESDWVMIEADGGLFRLHAPTLMRLGNLLMWRDTRTTWGYDYWAYLGLTLVVLGLLGAWTGLRGTAGPERRKLAIAVCACLPPALLLYNPVVRDVIFLFFFLSILVGIGAEALRFRHGRVLLTVSLLVFADLFSTSVQPIARNDKGFALLAGETLQRTAPNERIVMIGVSPNGQLTADVGPDADPLSFIATVQRLAGNHNMAATRVHNYAISAAKAAERDLQRDGVLSASTRRILGLLNVTRIICQSSVRSGCPASVRDAIEELGLGRVVRIAGTPVVFSQHLAELSPEAGIDKPMIWEGDFGHAEAAPRLEKIMTVLQRVADAEQIDPETGLAKTILIRGHSVEPALDPAWRPRLTAYAVGLERISLTIVSNGSGYVQIAHPWFPATAVFVDGRPVEMIQGTIGLLVIPVDPGEHQIEIVPVTTPIRQAAAALSFVGIGLTLAGTAFASRRRIA